MESKLNTNWSNGEIITIGFGHFGVECVDNFFQEIASEHGLLNESKHQSGDTKNLVGQEARLDMPNVCFNETSQNLGFSARCLVIDVNMGHLNTFSNSNGSMFSEGNVINLNGTASRDFASGYYNLKENVSQIMNAVQKEAEKCEYLKGFNIKAITKEASVTVLHAQSWRKFQLIMDRNLNSCYLQHLGLMKMSIRLTTLF